VTILNTAAAIYAGDVPALHVYRGDVHVWPPSALPPPVITSINPTKLTGGTTASTGGGRYVYIDGPGYDQATDRAYLDGVEIASQSFDSATSISAFIQPPTTPGVGQITVVGPGGPSNALPLRFDAPAPDPNGWNIVLTPSSVANTMVSMIPIVISTPDGPVWPGPTATLVYWTGSAAFDAVVSADGSTLNVRLDSGFPSGGIVSVAKGTYEIFVGYGEQHVGPFSKAAILTVI
jgi:hypothetical protein